MKKLYEGFMMNSSLFEYYKKNFNLASHNIFFLKLLYILNIPLAHVLTKLNFSPNFITTVSNFFALSSLIALIYFENIVCFMLLWIFGEFLDVCDGMVARSLGKTSANGALYDKMTDQVKLILLFGAVGYKYNSLIIWIFSFFSSTFMLFYTVLNYNLDCLELKLKLKSDNDDSNDEKIPYKRKEEKVNNTFFFKKNIKQIISFIRNNVFTIHGHTMILIVPIALNQEMALVIMLFLLLAVFRHIYFVLKRTIVLNRVLETLQ